MAKQTVQKALLKAEARARRGEIEEARGLYRDVLEQFPNNKRAQQGLARLGQLSEEKTAPPQDILNEVSKLYNSGQLKALAGRMPALLRDYPQSIVLWNVEGAINFAFGYWDKAEQAFLRILEIDPHYAAAYSNLGVALKAQGQLDRAVDCYTRAVELQPDQAGAHNNLGNALKEQGQIGRATDCYRRAIALQPDSAEPHQNLGEALRELGQIDEAIGNCTRAIALKPDYAEAYNSLGIAFQGQGRLDEAIANYAQAVKVKPDFADAYYNAGLAFDAQGRKDEAIRHFALALQYKPDFAIARARLLFAKRNVCDWTEETDIGAACAVLGIEGESVSPFATLFLEDDPQRQMRRSVNLARDKYCRKPLPLPERPRTRPAKLRIGVFSSDFAEHAVFFMMSGLLREYDRDRFELHAYSFGEQPVEKHREAIGGLVDGFTDIRNLPTARIVDQARADDLQIAIDVNGLTRFSRSDLFAFRLAPIQINYLGYAGTIGGGFMDYIVADPVLIPEEHRDAYAENVIYLPDTYMPSDNRRAIAETDTRRSDFGLPENGLVFACFNNFYKISPAEFDIWMRLLRQVVGSALWLPAANETVKANLRKEAAARGVDADRIVFADRLPSVAEHLARLKHADLFLDTFNYNAHATASDALWAGLPVVTKIGRQFSARVAASLLSAVGLPELITASEEEYERLILELAADPQRLAEIRAKLARNRDTHPLFDTVRYTRHFEQAMDEAFDRHLKGRAPEDFRIRAI